MTDSHVEEWQLDLPGHTLTVTLFKDVSNARRVKWPSKGALRDKVLAGSLEPECALVNAALVPDAIVLRAAAEKALMAKQRGTLRCKSAHAELVFNLSGSKHIGETLQRYGISPDCRHLLAARFDATPEEAAALQSLVSGTPAPLSELAQLTDAALLKKYLKVTPEELAVGTLADAQLVRIAARDC
ncbi:hypothetical protein ABPG77_001629 [Micractinium sp. CCAP 211/92]